MYIFISSVLYTLHIAITPAISISLCINDITIYRKMKDILNI